jgi:N-acetylglucosamine malate deacetylase 2
VLRGTSTILAIVILAIVCCCKQPENVKQYAAIETYAEDTILAQIAIKRAMVVIAHDDDMCALAGTVSQLNKLGWEIATVSIARTPERDSAHAKACRNILDTVMFVQLSPNQIRNDLKGNRPEYYAFPKDSFHLVFNKPLVEAEYARHINAFSPSIIFTLDSDMGGYGHPEHVLVSQMVVDLAKAGRLSPQYVFQSVYTDHMENTIMARHSKRMKSWGFPGDEWENAKKIYGVTGMPEPTVQINIENAAREKMEYLRSYNERERKILGFFIPEFENYDPEEYFRIFNREFFRVIKI